MSISPRKGPPVKAELGKHNPGLDLDLDLDVYVVVTNKAFTRRERERDHVVGSGLYLQPEGLQWGRFDCFFRKLVPVV